MNKQSATTQSQGKDNNVSLPKNGDHYRCAKCGMTVEVVADCRCKQPENVHFECCGQNLNKV